MIIKGLHKTLDNMDGLKNQNDSKHWKWLIIYEEKTQQKT